METKYNEEDYQQSLVLAQNYLAPLEKKVYGDITLGDIRSSSMSLRDKEICLACYGKAKITVMAARDSGMILRAIINKTLFEGGQAVEDIDEFMLIILADIYRDWSDMTVDEVAIAFRMGVREEFGELRGISVRVLNTWLRSYKALIKKEAMKNLIEMTKPKEKVVTDAQKKIIHANWLKSWCDTYDKWAKGGNIVMLDPNNMFYKYASKNKFLVLTEEEIAKMYTKAEIIFKKKHSAEKANGKAEKATFKDALQKLQKGDEEIKQRVLSEARILFIWELFNRLKATKKSLKEVVSELNR